MALTARLSSGVVRSRAASAVAASRHTVRAKLLASGRFGGQLCRCLPACLSHLVLGTAFGFPAMSAWGGLCLQLGS